jgi:hypothetical protein
MGAVKELALEKAYDLVDEILKLHPDELKKEMEREGLTEVEARHSLVDEAFRTIIGGPEADSIFDQPWVFAWIRKALPGFNHEHDHAE